MILVVLIKQEINFIDFSLTKTKLDVVQRKIKEKSFLLTRGSVYRLASLNLLKNCDLEYLILKMVIKVVLKLRNFVPLKV